MERQIHICIITTAHVVDDVRVNAKIAQYFLSEGFSVSWVGPGYANVEGENQDQNSIAFNLGPPIKGRLSRIFSSRQIERIASSIKGVDVYYAPDPDSALLAQRLAHNNGAKVVFDVHEIFHGALLDRYLGGMKLSPIRKYIQRRISRTCNKCDLVIGVSDAVLDEYLSDISRRMTVRSCAPTWFASNPPADVCGSGKLKFTIMHGKFDRLRGTGKVLEALSVLKKKQTGISAIMFKVRNHSKQLTMLKLDMGLEEVVDLRESVPMSKMPSILRDCDAGLIAYGRSLGQDSLPNRLFEYMAAGLAIIAPAYSREISKIIIQEKCGLLVDFENPIEIADAIKYLIENPGICREMGLRAREAFVKRHNWEVEVRPFLDKIKSWFHLTKNGITSK